MHACKFPGSDNKKAALAAFKFPVSFIVIVFRSNDELKLGRIHCFE